MYFKNIKKEIKATISRKKRKVFIANANLYALGKQYNFLIFFFRHYNIKLSNKLITNLIKEELGFYYSFNNWIH